MQKLSGRQSLLFSIILFAATALISYFYPEYAITVGGLLICIFLTVFIPGKRSTLIMAALAIIVIMVSVIFIEHSFRTALSVTQNLFSILLVIFATLIVLHLKKLYFDIHSGKAHLASLFENATEGIVLTDGKGKIVLVNPAVERMFDYTSGELVDQFIEILIPQEYRKGHMKLREGFLASPQDRTMGSGRDLHGTKKSGENFPVEVSLSHYYKNNELFVIAFIVDITQRKTIEENMIRQKIELENVTSDMRKLNAQLEGKVEERTLILKEALQRLEQSQQELSEALDKEKELSEIKSRFVSMASHEFRTPLSTVLSSASLLSRYTSSEDQDKRDKHITRIKESVKNLNDILEDFLSLGKLDEGKVHTSYTEFDLQDLIQNTTDEMRGLLKQGQQFISPYNGQTMVVTDKKLLRNILINLIGNAIKFSGEGAAIEIKSNISPERAAISVIDKGIGISKEDQDHLFSSFFRGKNALNIQGTGLGLHIVKRYLDLLGGDVHLQSELNKGTAITITIPIDHSI